MKEHNDFCSSEDYSKNSSSLPFQMYYWKFYSLDHEVTFESYCEKYNTNNYAVDKFYKPISKIINLDV